jgi:ABC-type glutathione transport system ATPase component
VGEALAGLASDGASILVTEQKTDLLAAIARRAVVLAEGRVVLEGPATSVLADPMLDVLGVEAPAGVRLARLAAAAGVDPTRLKLPA